MVWRGGRVQSCVRPVCAVHITAGLDGVHGYMQRRACRLVGLEPKTYRYATKRPDDAVLRQRLKDLASQRRRFARTLLFSFRDIAAPAVPSHPLR